MDTPLKTLKRSFIHFMAAALCLAALAAADLRAQSPAAKSKAGRKPDSALTLEQFFAQGKLFATRASGMAFSFDGKYAAYMYRPFEDRFEGDDLWVLEVLYGLPPPF